MDFESVEVMSTLDVTGVSKSLEQAAAKVKELAKLWSAKQDEFIEDATSDRSPKKKK